MDVRVVGRIFGAQFLSSAGTSMSTVALAFMVYTLTGSVLHMGGILAVSVLPLVVMSWLGGALLDRYSARNIMVLADLVRAVLILAMPFLAERMVGLVYLVAGLMGVCSALFNPGQVKLVGELVDGEHLVKANSYVGVSRDGAELLGYLVGGVLVTYVGYTLTFAIDSFSYLLSALLLVGLPKGTRQEGPLPTVGRLVRESPAVLGRLWRHPGLRTNLLFGAFASAAVMMNVPNSYGLALEVFDRGAGGLAALEVFVAVGLILGGIVISRMSLRGDKNAYVFWALVAMGLCLIGVSYSGFFWLSISLMGLAGMFNVGVFVPSITMFQEVPAIAERGRLISLRAGFGQLGMAAGLALGGLLGAAVGITRLFLLAGVATIVLCLIIYLPYKVAAGRRARAAWNEALGSGARRAAARRAAQEAAAGGASPEWAATAQSTTAWAAAERVATEEAAAATAGILGEGPAAGALAMEENL
jgi:MFS family permease